MKSGRKMCRSWGRCVESGGDVWRVEGDVQRVLESGECRKMCGQWGRCLDSAGRCAESGGRCEESGRKMCRELEKMCGEWGRSVESGGDVRRVWKMCGKCRKMYGE